MVLMWSLRMAVFLLIRDHYRPEQRQYRLMRIEFLRLFTVKVCQKYFLVMLYRLGLLAVYLLLYCLILVEDNTQWTGVHTFALGAFTVGLIVQTIADYQLHSFSKNIQRVSGTF